MQTGMSRSMIGQIVDQTRKITVFRVTGGVRVYIEISRIFNKFPYQLNAWFLSKNAPVRQNFCEAAQSIYVAQCLPVT